MGNQFEQFLPDPTGLLYMFNHQCSLIFSPSVSSTTILRKIHAEFLLGFGKVSETFGNHLLNAPYL